MSLSRLKWMLFIIPALVIGGFETIRHTLLEQVLPLEIGNWATAVIDSAVIAMITRKLFQQFNKTQHDLNEERMLRAVLEERERVGRILHDHISQTIFYAGVQIASAQELAREADQRVLIENLDDLKMSLREIDDNVRQAIFNLREDLSEASDLTIRIRSYLNRTLDSTNIKWTLDATPIPNLSSLEQIHLFGILQEAITNVLKHSDATEVRILLHGGSQEGVRWVFNISDNGRGFLSTKESDRHFGLEIMNSRAREIKAEILIDSDSNGTKIRVIAQR